MTQVLVLVGTRRGTFILESDGERADWTVRGPTLAGWEVSEVSFDGRRSPPRLFAAVDHFVYGSTIHRSDDLGETWEQVTESPAYAGDSERELNSVWTVVPGRPGEPETVYAGVDEAGLFVSRDGGDEWEEVRGLGEHESRSNWFPGKGGLCCHSVLVDPSDPDQMWVGISAVGVFRTIDGGTSWTLQNDGLEIVAPDDEHDGIGSCVHRLVHHPSRPERIFQQNHRGVFRSTDAADSWERVDDGLPSTFGFPIVVHPHDPETIYTFPLESDEVRMTASGQPAVYRSTDAGDSWDRLRDGLPSNSWVTVLRQAMAVDALESVGVYAGTTGGRIFYSRDEGDGWQTMDCHLPRIQSLNAVVLD